ncbi:MAG: alpha/beta hydrolase [Actinobacteria bacterium]|nr:alpha/beta hydrolase [Actinomycetota bacterium]
MRSSDGTGIAWRADGPADAPAVVLCNGIACDDGYWSRVWPQLAADHRVVRWHYRGHGRSDPPANREEVYVSSIVRDLEAVAAAADVERAVLVGHSFGVQVVAEAFRARRDLVAGLVAVAGAFGHPLGTLRGRDPGVLLFPLLELATWPAPRALTGVLRAGLRSPLAYWIGRAIGGIGSDAPRETMEEYFEHVAGLDPQVLLPMFRAMQAHSSEDVLPGIDVPTVVLSGADDGMTPPRRAARMARAIPGAELIELPRATHVLPIEEPDEVVDAVRRVVARAERSA